MQPSPIVDSLDDFLRGVVQALHVAISRGIVAADKDAAAAQRTLSDCKEILDVIMAGNVNDWIAG